MSDKVVLLVNSVVAAGVTNTTSVTFTGVPTAYDVLEFSVAGTFSVDGTDATLGAWQIMSIEMFNTWDATQPGGAADVKGNYLHSYAHSYGNYTTAQTVSRGTTAGAAGDEQFFGKNVVAFGSASPSNYRGMNWTGIVVGPASGYTKRMFWWGGTGSDYSNANMRITQGLVGLDTQRNTSTRDVGRGPIGAVRVGLVAQGTQAGTAPYWEEGTMFQLRGYVGSGEGW
jgi:hypothetical protein